MIDEILEHVEKIIYLIKENPQEDLALVEELAQQMYDEIEMISDN